MIERKSTIAATGKNTVNASHELDEVEQAAPARARLRDVSVLSLADEQDSGGDPYNNTGQFCRLPEEAE